MGPATDSLQPLYLAQHTTSMQFETKHTPVTQTNRPRSPFESVEQLNVAAMRGWYGSKLSYSARQKHVWDFKPDGTRAAR